MGYRGGSSSPPALSGLQGVAITSPAHGQLLRYWYGLWRNGNPAFSNLQIGDTDPMVLSDVGIQTQGRGIDLTPPSGVPVNLPAGFPLWFELTEISDSNIGIEYCPMIVSWNDTLSRYEWINITEGVFDNPEYPVAWRNILRVLFNRVGLTDTFTIQTQFVAEEPAGSVAYSTTNDPTPAIWDGSDWVTTPPTWSNGAWSALPYGWTLGSYALPTVPIVEMGGGELRSSSKIETDALVVSAGAAPVPSGAGTVGEIRWAGNYLYICVAANTWRRAALSTWTP
jgi:hypothetical protein